MSIAGSPRLRIVVMGSTGFVLPSFEALTRAGHRIVCVYTQPPRPSGRGHKILRTPVHEAAEAAGIEVRTPSTLKDGAAQEAFAALQADVAVTGAYGLLLPPPILRGTTLGCVNLHASLLPRWRGAAPIERAILAGDTRTGLTVFVMDEGLDTGPVLAERALAIGPEDTASALHVRLAELAAELIVPTLKAYAAGTLHPTPQPADGACYAPKLRKEEGLVPFTEAAEQVERRLRALNPRPGCWAPLDGVRLGLLQGRAVERTGEPGTVIAEPLVVACATGAIALTEVRKEGGRSMSAAEFVRGRPVPVGTRLA